MCVFHNVILVAINGLNEKDDIVMLHSLKERSEELARVISARVQSSM